MSLAFRYYFCFVSLAIQLIQAQPPPTDAKHQFCSQPYFDSVFFDGHSYRFVVKKQPSKKQVDVFTVSYNSTANRFTNFTHHISSSPYILQGGFQLGQLYVQFYYRDPVGYEETDQRDFRAYELQFCEFQRRPASNSVFNPQACKRSESLALLSPNLTTSFTPKHRLYFFDPKAKCLWALLYQNPPYIGRLSFPRFSLSANYPSKWKFTQVESGKGSHLYTGVFTLRGHNYIVQESISSAGLRRQNVVTRLTDMGTFSLAKMEIPINQFFNCGKALSLPNIDQRLACLNWLMLICTSALAALLVLTIICSCTNHYKNSRVFRQNIEIVQSLQASSSPVDIPSTSGLHQ